MLQMNRAAVLNLVARRCLSEKEPSSKGLGAVNKLTERHVKECQAKCGPQRL